MAAKSKSNKHPWWAKIILLLFFIMNSLIADMILQRGFLTAPSGLKTYAAFIIFGEASSLLVAGVIYLFYRGARAYDNKGDAIDRSHIWVNAKSGKKVNDATVKNVYEKQHGYGSWEKKVEKERGCVTVFAILAAAALSIYGFYALSFRVRLPLLTAVQGLMGSTLVYILSWLGSILLGGFSIFMLYLAFYDVVNYNTAIAFSPGGHPLGMQNEFPSLMVFLPKIIAFILALLLNLAVLIYTLWPSLLSAPIGKHYTTVLAVTYAVSGFLWLFGALLQDVKESAEYRRQQDLNNKKIAIEESVEKFFGKDTEYKDRLIAGLVLLGNRDSLTYDGKKGVVDVLKLISGQDYGTDYPKWEDWLMKQLMK